MISPICSSQHLGQTSYLSPKIALWSVIEDVKNAALEHRFLSKLTAQNAINLSVNVVLFSMDPGLYSLIFGFGFILQSIYPSQVAKMEKAAYQAWNYTGRNHNFIIKTYYRLALSLLAIWVLPYTMVAVTVAFAFETAVGLCKNSSHFFRQSS